MSSSLPALKPQEIAHNYNLSLSTIYRLIQSGALPSVRIGRQLRIRQFDFEKYLQSNTAYDPVPSLKLKSAFSR